MAPVLPVLFKMPLTIRCIIFVVVGYTSMQILEVFVDLDNWYFIGIMENLS